MSNVFSPVVQIGDNWKINKHGATTVTDLQWNVSISALKGLDCQQALCKESLGAGNIYIVPQEQQINS